MRLILITNDDGISAGGMRRLAEQAVKHGEVWIVAPDSQRSAAPTASRCTVTWTFFPWSTRWMA